MNPLKVGIGRGDLLHAPALLHERGHLTDGVPRELELEAGIFAQQIPSVLDDLRSGAVRSDIISNYSRCINLSDFDYLIRSHDFNGACRCREWTEIHEDTLRREDAPDFPKGIDHALTRKASQRPREESDVKSPVAKWQRHGTRRQKAETPPDIERTSSSLGNLLDNRIDAHRETSGPCVAEGQSAVSRADFEHACVEKIRGLEERFGLCPLRIESAGHRLPMIQKSLCHRDSPLRFQGISWTLP